MDHKGILSSAFNMSMGFIPVIISILLCEFITQDTAIYIGTVIGIVGVYLSYHRKGILLPNFILYISAGILILLSLAALIPGDYVPEGALPLSEHSHTDANTLYAQEKIHQPFLETDRFL